jgi:prolyl oligopeptidase
MTTSPSQRPQYPDAPRDDVADNMHGTLVQDPYRWLEDAADPRTQEWVAQQNALMQEERAKWSRREHFAERVDQLLQSGSVSPPYFRGDRIFFTRRNPGQQFSVLYVREGAGAERVLIDPMELDPSGLTTLDAWQPSKE